jgi:hypothetical protein
MVKTFSEIGLPSQCEVVSLFFHHQTATLITQTGALTANRLPKRLYFRSVSALDYQPIGTFPQDVSIDSVTTDEARPLVYFLTNRWEERNGVLQGVCDGLYRFELETHQCERLIDCRGLIPPPQYQQVWPAMMLSVSSDGGSIYCQAGLQRRDGDVDYAICSLQLASAVVSQIMLLEAVFA